MSYSWIPACVRHGPCAETAKYRNPSAFGALEVTPRYFRSAARASANGMQWLVEVPVHLGSRPLVAVSSKPATVERIASSPEPCLTCFPDSGRSADCTEPCGRVTDFGWVMVDAGRGAEYTGTRSCGCPELVNSTRPLASAT